MTHPDWVSNVIPASIQKEYADKGVIIEKVFWNLPPQQMCQSARDIGKGRVFFSSDRGQAGKKMPADAMLEFIEDMLAFGLDDDEIRSLIVDVPRQVLGIS